MIPLCLFYGKRMGCDCKVAHLQPGRGDSKGKGHKPGQYDGAAIQPIGLLNRDHPSRSTGAIATGSEHKVRLLQRSGLRIRIMPAL